MIIGFDVRAARSVEVRALVTMLRCERASRPRRHLVRRCVCFFLTLGVLAGSAESGKNSASWLCLCVHLFEMFNLSPVLQNVLRAITFRGCLFMFLGFLFVPRLRRGSDGRPPPSGPLLHARCRWRRVTRAPPHPCRAAFAPRLGSPRPHLRQDWAGRCHICAGTGPACRSSLIQTVVLGVVFFYFFAVWGFAYFPSLFKFGDPDIVGGFSENPSRKVPDARPVGRAPLRLHVCPGLPPPHLPST